MIDITRRRFIQAAACAPALACWRAGAAESAAESLFNGADFSGWEGNLDWFRIEDGAIVGGSLEREIPQNEFLCTRRSYADFELTLETRLLGKNPNAGIQIRSRRIPDHHEMIGYQADLGQQYWGCLYDKSRRKKVLEGPGPDKLAAVLDPRGWNTYRIRCEGRRIQLWFNELQTVDYTEPDESIKQEGLIGLQIHSGPPAEAWYRKLRLEPLQRRSGEGYIICAAGGMYKTAARSLFLKFMPQYRRTASRRRRSAPFAAGARQPSCSSSARSAAPGAFHQRPCKRARRRSATPSEMVLSRGPAGSRRLGAGLPHARDQYRAAAPGRRA